MKTRQKLPVRFWHGMNLKKVLDELTPADKKQLNRLMSGDENSELNLEKLRNSSVYSLRVNSGRRILFTTIQGKGKEKNKHIALILEILPTHDYTNAKCLKPQVLNQFLKRANIEGLVFEAVTHVEGIEKSESPIDDDEIDLELIEYVYDKGRGITLTDEQQNIQHHLEMPCYILGMGGCGKTSVINAIIIDRVEEHVLHDTVPALPIVYVTESKPLADAQRAQWMQHPLASTPAGERVLFLSSSEAIASYSTAVRVAGYHEIKDNDLIKRIQAKVKSLSFNKFDTESNVQKLMHEFEIIAACETDKTYFTLGQHQSNYTNQSERKLLWRASEEIKNTLQVDGLYSARLYREKPGTLEKQCSLVIIDEAHSGARVVKLNLKRLSEYFIGCVDSLQSMQKAISDVTYLIEHTGTTTTKPANIYTLKQNFRNPARVIHLANGLNRLRRFVLGGKGDKTEQTTFDSTAASDDNIGTVTFIENKNINKLIETVNTDRADFAIITTAENKEKAKLRYKNPQVFTAPEIGGLEYDNIIIDNLFDKNILAQLNTVLSAYTPEAKVSVNRPKETSAYTDTNSFFNILNTAFTRPRKRLYIVDASPDRKTQAFYKHIIDLINTGDKTYASTVEVKSDDVRSESTPADWMARVDELVLNNKMSMARDIWINHLQLPEQTFVEKYQPSVEHPNILFRLDLDDLALPRLAELKKMLNKRNYHSLFLDCKKDQPGLMFKLLSSTDGQDRIEALFQHNFEKTASLFCALLNSNLEIRIPDEEPQDVFMWLILDVHRGSIVNRLAERHPAFANKMIAEMEKRLPVIKEGVDESKEKLIPLVMILGVISPTLFEQTFMKFPDRVKASMCHFWFHRVTSDDHPNGAPFIVHLADDTPRDTLSYLDGVDFPIHHFISPDGEINAPTVNALLVTRGGVRLLNRCLYEPASPIQAARLSCDEFMLEPIASIRHQSKGTRFDYLLSRGNASGHWVKSYLIYHPNRVAFFTARVPSRENPAVSISRIASFFENRAFTTTMIGLAKTAPDEVRTIFKDVNFHFLTAQNEYFLVYLIYSSFSLPDGSDIIGLDVFALLLDVMKSGLIRLENLGEFMKEFLKVQTIDAESTITCLGYLTRYKPASFVQLLRCYPALVTFITHEDLTDLNYDFKKRCLIELILMTEINGNRFLAIYAFLTASDYYLFRTTPVDTWLRSDIANSLCENPLGVTLLLKLIELTSVDALLDYNKNHFSAVMQLNSLEKTRKVFIAMKTKIQSNTTPEPLALEVPKTIEAPTMTQSTSVEQYFGSMDLAQIEISELTTLIKNTPDASVKAKILAFLRKVKFHENHHESKEEVITTFMKLSEKAELRYKNPQVFTAPEIGGLEYDNIIIDNLFDKNILAQLNTVLSAYTPEAKVSVNRPKETSAYTDTNSFFNILNTAFTRPRKRLYIVDASPDRKTQAFYKHIIDLINTGDKTYASTVEVKSDDVRSESTPADWMARVDELVLNNKMSMARDIWINHLQLPEQTFVEKYQPSVEHPNILFRLDLDDLALPRLAELKKMLNKRNYHSLFLDCKKDQPGLMFKLLSSTDGQDRIEALFQHNFEKTASLFCALLNSNLEIRIPDEEPQDVFMWLILDVHRGSIVNRLAERHPAFANKMIAEMEKRLPVIKEGVDESKEKLIPLVMILGVISPTLFEQTFMKFPDRVKASMCHFWFHRVTSDDHPNGAPFIVHLADDTPRDTLSYLDGVDFPIHHFISPDGEINAPTVNALLVTRGGVRLLNRCLYEPASPIQAARLSCDEFMLEPIASIRHQSKGTRFDYLLSRGNASGHWVKSYLIYHPNRVAFFTARVPSRENPAVSISRIASFFENRAFTTTMIGLAKTAPDEVRTIFKDVNFHFLTAQNEYFLVYLIYSSFSLPDGSDIIGLDVFALLLDVMKSGLIRLENLGEFMKEFLKVQTIDAESTITCLGYLTRYKPASFVQLLRCYPALVTFITHEDLTDLNYDFKKRCLIELILMTEINGNRFLAIYAFLTASDYYLFRTTPVDTWLRSDIANSLCENPLGVTLLLKLIELTSVDALLDYNKNHFSAVMQLNSLEKTRKVFIAMKTKIQSNTTPEPLALEVPKTIEAPTMTQSTSVEQYFGSMDLAQIEISELTTLIKNTPDASVKAKILAFLRKVKFHENHHESKEEVITTFMKLSEKADGRQFIVACFEEYGRQWIRFDEDSIALLFKIFNSSVADVCNSAAGYFLEEKIEIFYHLGVCFPEMIDCLRDQFLKDRPEIGAVGTYFYGLTLSDNAQLVLNTIFAREALSTTQLDKLITELSMRHRVHEDQSFHHFSWNSLVLIIEGRELRQFFITLVEKNPELLRKLPLEAWSSPVDPYDQPTDSRNYVSLYLFKRSIEGIAYFENHSENYPDLVAATKNPCEYQFNTDEECQDLLTTSYIKHYQKQYKPDNLTLTQLKDFGISPTGNRLLDLFYNKDILSLLSYRPQTTNVNIEFNLFCTLLQNPKSCKDLLFFFDNSSYIMRSFFDRIDFQSVVVCHKKSISYQKLLFSSKQSLSIIECFIRHYPGKLRHYSTFDQSFSEFKPADFDNLFGSCNSILQETLKKEFPALQLITVTKKEEKVTSNTSTHFTQPVQPKNKTHANNKKRRPKK